MSDSGKIVLVTGACGDIGRETALAFAHEGARVLLNDIAEPALAEDTISRIRQLGAQAAYFRGDVRDRHAVEKMLDEAEQNFGPIEICVGNAAVVTPQAFLDLTEDEWTRHLDTNLTGCFHVGQACARRMVRAGIRGMIIFVSSWVQDVPQENIAAYCVSKSGLRMLARVMALELGRHGIRVNLVAPGFVDAGLSGKLFQQQPGLREECAAYAPLGYVESPQGVASSIVMLCGPGAGYMTGATLLVDGGNSLFLRGGKVRP